MHKALFAPLLDRNAPDAVQEYTRSKLRLRVEILEQHLAQHDYLLDSFSVADAYLFTVLNWTQVTQIELATWPAIHAYQQRVRQRPTVARALAEEYAIYQQEQARVAAA